MHRGESLLSFPLFSPEERTQFAPLVQVVQGDLSHPLPLSAALACQDVSIVIHCVGSVSLNEQLRAGLLRNAVPARNIIDFAKRLPLASTVLIMSNAFVNIDSPPGTTVSEDVAVNPLPSIDPEAFLDHVLLLAPEEVRAMQGKIMGDHPNAHLFAKAVTEQLVLQRRERLNVILLRPSFVGPALKDPCPGWIDSARSLGSAVLLNGVGILRSVAARGDVRVDVVPVDFVANAAVLAVEAAVRSQGVPRGAIVIHCTAPTDNPLTWDAARVYINEYWSQHPPQRAASPPSLSYFSSELLYRMWFWASHDVPRAAADAAAALVPTDANLQRARRRGHTTDALAELHETLRPFARRSWRFEQSHLPQLVAGASSERRGSVLCDLNALSWRFYVSVVCFGVRRFLLDEVDIVPPFDLMVGSMLTQHNDVPQSWFARWFPDLSWAWNASPHPEYAPRMEQSLASLAAITEARKTGDPVEASTSTKALSGPRTPLQLKRAVMQDARVKEAMAAHPDGEVGGRIEVSKILDEMGHTLNPSISRVSAIFLRKIFRSIYGSIHVDPSGVERLRQAVASGTVAMIPTHRSYVDFLLMSYMCFEYNIPLPHIAAGEDFLAVMFVNWIFRNAGAFFIRRSFKDDPLYWAVFASYIQTLAMDKVPVEFFIEGTRSRSGKTLFPKLGMLGLFIEPALSGQLDDVTIAPVSIAYEKVLEAELYSYELLGSPKPRESFQNLLKARQVLRQDFGRIHVTFGEHISVADFSRAQGPSCSKKNLIRGLGYAIVGQLQAGLAITASALFASTLMVYRRGIERRRLARTFAWLRRACEERGATVAFTGSPEAMVDYAFRLHSNLVVDIRGGMLQPLMKDEAGAYDAKPLIVLAFYRNQLMHLFYVDGLTALVLNSFADGTATHSAVMSRLDFLRTLFATEFPTAVTPCPLPLFESALMALVNRGHVELRDGAYYVTGAGRAPITFMSHLYWPFVDSYWIAALAVVGLVPYGIVSKKDLLSRMSFMAEQLFNEGKTPYAETASLDVLGNAFFSFVDRGILQRRPATNTRGIVGRLVGPADAYCLTPTFQNGDVLQGLVEQLAHLRQAAAASGTSTVQSVTSNFPILARLTASL